LQFVQSLLLLETSPALSWEEQQAQRAERRRFALKLQQVTAPVTAKGVEDTALYRLYPLAALNEVGGLIEPQAMSITDFHRSMQARAKQWPHSLTATATHDTKRGEDTRARLLALSEVADEWVEQVHAWQRLTHELLEHVGDRTAPSRAEQYLIFQTLVGTWPLHNADRSGYTERITNYLQKALREAKQNTSWLNPDEEYEHAVATHVEQLLDGNRCPQFVEQLDQFARRIAWGGVANSLGQTVLKICLPGVPDFYQGTELCDFSLVDPDNRRPVDFDERRLLLEQLQESHGLSLGKFMTKPMPDAALKLGIVARALAVRRAKAEVFAEGDYLPLVVEGSGADNVVAFARRRNEWVVAAITRHPLRLGDTTKRNAWGDTIVRLPEDAPKSWREVFRDAAIQGSAFKAAQLLGDLPVALLVSEPFAS
jgi:(1->4)-alpha-D-glucan 1-alpha-D-glucosylmutase